MSQAERRRRREALAQKERERELSLENSHYFRKWALRQMVKKALYSAGRK